MSRFKIINIVDIVFISAIIFLISFAWIQFFLKNLVSSLFLAAVLTSGIMLLAKWASNKKHSHLQNALNKSNKLAAFKISIQTMPHSKLISHIKQLIPTNINTTTKKGKIFFVKDGKLNALTFHHSSPLSDGILMDIIKTNSADNITVFCSSFTPDANTICKAFKDMKIQLITLDQLYDIFEQNDININTSNISIHNAKLSFKDILKGFISPQKSKGFFISGIIVLLTSVLVPYKIYYVVISTILFALSAACRFKPKIKNNKNIF